ncbi:MAG: OmpA family protein [Clostridia bacterium]|nr:OmpA family protein [Clostridia bacterium]
MRPGKRLRRGGENGSYWISYSDMMAGMLFTFALILFMAVYQIVDLQQKKTIELETKEAQLSTQQSLLIDQEAQLKDKEELLAATTLMLQQQQEELEENRTALTAAQQSLSLQQSKIEEQAALLAAQQTQIDKLIGLRSQIIEDLRDELRGAGLDAVVDKKTGAIAFTGAVLFDTGKNELKQSGKTLLNAFIPVYIRTLMSEEYEGYVGEIIIEGHTDTSGSYLSNLALSQERALAVATYCLGSEMTGLTESEKLVLQSILTANGRSYADPVYMDDGVTVDMEASRRVVFKFRMKDSEMIDQMSAILEEQQGE